MPPCVFGKPSPLLLPTAPPAVWAGEALVSSRRWRDAQLQLLPGDVTGTSGLGTVCLCSSALRWHGRMALPLAPGVQVGETCGCHLLNAAGTSGNLFWVWFLFQKMCCLLLQTVMMRLGGWSAHVVVVAIPSWERVFAWSVFGEPVVCGGSSCWRLLLALHLGDAGTWRRGARNFPRLL